MAVLLRLWTTSFNVKYVRPPISLPHNPAGILLQRWIWDECSLRWSYKLKQLSQILRHRHPKTPETINVAKCMALKLKNKKTEIDNIKKNWVVYHWVSASDQCFWDQLFLNIGLKWSQPISQSIPMKLTYETCFERPVWPCFLISH